MSRKTRAIHPETLETPERGLELSDRAAAAPEPEPEPERDDSEIRRRIQAMKEALPIAVQGSCRACFHRGARAALEVVGGEGGDIRDRIAALKANYPPDPDPHDARSYKGGVEAVLQAMTG